MNYYNEIEPFAANWLKELIREGCLPHGVVDKRNIRDVMPSDLGEFTQCHFFAGIGGWPLALQFAGWPEDKPVWTGSCPCQSFSSAGKGAGFLDERHLWPAWFHLIRECRPSTVFGEQVEAAAGHGWLDLVQSDMEGEGYALGHAVLGAHSVGAPHIRQRLWFVGQRLDDASSTRHGRTVEGAEGQAWDEARLRLLSSGSRDGQLADDTRSQGWSIGRDSADQRVVGSRGLADESSLDDGQCHGWREIALGHNSGDVRLVADAAGPWSDLIWLPCRDGKARPTPPGIQPLSHGVPNRVGTLRGAGNAIVPQVAAEFIKATMALNDPDFDFLYGE